MSMISLRSRLSFMKGLAPSAATRADLSGSSRGSPADALGDLRVTVRASPPGTPPRTSYSSRSEHPIRFPSDFAGLSHGAPSISFGAPSVDRMSIAASGDGFRSSEDEKSKLSPVQRISFLGVELDSVSMTARLTEERAQAVLNCLSCTIGVVLSFLQERLERRLSPSTLKVYVAAIAAHHDAVDGRSLGEHDLIVRFLKGARRMNPSRPPLVPSWDLSIVLAGLQRGPFEPLDSVELKFLSLKTALLTALTSIKRVRGPPGVFGKRRVPCVRAGLLSRCLETPAWIRAQGSHHALPRSGGEPASTALGGGRSSLSVAVARKSIAHIRDPHPERQKLRAALCLPSPSPWHTSRKASHAPWG